MDVVSISLPLLVGLIALALLFDFINGLHDAANSIATIVSTRVLRPQIAVAWAAFFNFIAFLFFGLHVARTLGSGIVMASVIDANVIFGALMGATLWNVITWAVGIPSSSSHALIGGLVGAGVSQTPIPVGIPLLAWPRRQRRPENHGDPRRPAVLAGPSRQRVLRAVLGRAHMPGGHGPRDSARGLADCPHDGFEDHPAHAHAGLLRRDRRSPDLVRSDMARHSRLHDPHHHGSDRRGRGRAQSLGCPVGG